MPETANDRRQKRLLENLRRAEASLLEAQLEVTGRDDKRARAIRNALVATRYALHPVAVVSSKSVSDDPNGADK